MGVAVKLPSQFANLGLDLLLEMRWESAEKGVELMGLDLGRLVHGLSPFLDPHATRTEVGLAALNASYELRFQLSRLFQVIGKPVSKFHHLLPWESANLGFNHFELAHGETLPKGKRQFKSGDLPPAPAKLRRSGRKAVPALLPDAKARRRTILGR
jgi:hypothetical protein